MENKKIYDPYWTTSEKPGEEYLKWKINNINKYLIKNKKILDLGSGDCYISKNLDCSNLITCVDISDIGLKKCNQRSIRTLRYDINKKLPFKDNSFDIILMLDVLEHIIDPILLMSEARRVCREKGKIILVVPNSYNIFNRFLFFSGIKMDITDKAHITSEIFSEHLHQISLNSSKRLIRERNLKQIWMMPYFQTNKSCLLALLVTSAIKILKLHILWPSMFAYSYMFVTEKKS